MRRRNFDQYFWFNKVLMQSCGIMLLPSKFLFISYFLKVTPFITTWFLLFPAIYTLCFHSSRFSLDDKVYIILGYFEVYGFAAAKALVLLIKQHKLVKLVNEFSEMWTTFSDDDYKYIKVFPKQARYFTNGFTCLIMFLLISVLTTPLMESEQIYDVNGTKELPYRAGVFDYMHNDSRSYLIWYGLQIPAACFSITHVIATDVTYIFFILHACAYAKHCQYYFTQTIRELENDDSDVNYVVVKCIKYHQKFMEQYQITEDVFHFNILMQMIMSLGLICGYSVNILFQEEELAKYVMHLLAAVLQLWMYCWPVHMLWNEATKVANAAYDFPWYDWSKYHQSIVAIIITRSQRSAKFTAGKFVPVTLETFVSVLSTAMSFFTVLRQAI
uniref:Odorant receptor n=1 Tax=Aulacocentrum confusum TaxID=2767324 RepID=A0A7G8Z964_9HYME|nr:olfactory receptor 45 [Aulacocentrum confusum]